MFSHTQGADARRLGDNIAERESVMDYIAIREGFESWGEA